ncbi:glutamine amidotransferase [Acidobacteria bacterium AH-259-D05]|nr:glutamine amidotransferase [Acidobacteria bacterium AH-259-D05]
METLFTFFFKYQPFFFRRGEFTFQWSLNPWLTVLLLLALAAFLFLIYRHTFLYSKGKVGWTLLALRSSFFLLLFLLAMKPSLVLSRLVPKENLLAVLMDNSRSMGIPTETKQPRGRKAQELLREESDFLKDLDERFYLRLFRFDSRAQRVEQPLELDWHGDQTNIVSGLEGVLADTKNLPLAGIVLFTDGSDNSYRNFQEVLAELKARHIPVHTVGLGPESLSRDIEITQVSAPRVSIPETISEVRITFRHRGFGGSRGRLEVREGNSLVQTKEIFFPRDSTTLTTSVKIVPKSAGIKNYRFTLQPLEGEEIKENNSRTAIVQVRNLPARILYVEGHPRWEYKFIRRALIEDEHLRLVTLLRTALNKFYRQGIEEETTLAAGFPSEKEELFDYQGILFGSVESSFFTYQQMEMVRDFVGQRGGGFLMLGGSDSFASGQYQNTPIEEILPVWLHADGEEIDRSRSLYVQGESKLQLTDQGRQHPAFQLSLGEKENSSQWDEIPVLRDWNVVRGTKSGATILAQLDTSSGLGPDQNNLPLFVFQRYGRGHTLALLTGSSWQWQMLQDHEDRSHEMFWRQILRWLVNSAKDPITVETEREVYSQNETVELRAEVSDKAFNRLNDARVEASITSPSGEEFTLPLHWDALEDGVYRAQWTPHEDGFYTVQIQAEAKALEGHNSRPATTSFLTSTGSREYFDAFQKKDFLQKLALETGGNYYTISEAERLPEEILYTQSQTSVIEVLDLWDMPFNLFLLMALLFAEWILRKRHGFI